MQNYCQLAGMKFNTGSVVVGVDKDVGRNYTELGAPVCKVRWASCAWTTEGGLSSTKR